jgi:hypothetical protein
MNRNSTTLAIAALALAVIVLGYYFYREQQKTGIEINVGETGISIEER